MNFRTGLFSCMSGWLLLFFLSAEQQIRDGWVNEFYIWSSSMCMLYISVNLRVWMIFPAHVHINRFSIHKYFVISSPHKPSHDGKDLLAWERYPTLIRENILNFHLLQSFSCLRSPNTMTRCMNPSQNHQMRANRHQSSDQRRQSREMDQISTLWATCETHTRS